jgi:PAS domain S-box-containing protein
MKLRHKILLLLITAFCWSVALLLIGKDEQDTIREFHTTQRGALVLIGSTVNMARKMAPEGIMDYLVQILKDENFRNIVRREIKKTDTKDIAGYGNILIFDENGRLIFHKGDMPERYIGQTAAAIYSERIKKYGGKGFEKAVGGIEKNSPGIGQYVFSRGESPKLVAWGPITMAEGRVLMMLFYTDRNEVFDHLGFYYRAWLTFIGTFLFNVIFVIISMAYLQVVENKTRMEERALQRETIGRLEDRCRLLVETAGDGIVTFGDDGIMIDVNQGALNISGYSREELVGKHFRDFFDGPEKEVVQQQLVRLMSDGGTVNYETIGRTRSGYEIPVSISAAIFMHEGRRLFQATVRDITLLKAREQERINNATLRGEIEQLREMNLLKTNFLSMVSHELRTPLAVIIGNIGLLLKDGDPELPEDVATRLRTVQRRGRELKELIDDLLNLASIEAGKLEMQIRRIPVAELFSDAESVYKDYTKSRNIVFESRVESEDLAVDCDKIKLNHILNNLIKNAVKFLPGEGRISLTAAARDGEIVFSVTDNGPGIPENEIGHVFERFYQVDSSPTRPKGGAGVGLSIAREMAELHGGWIKLRNVKPHGLCAEFGIPAMAAETAGKTRRPTVIVIDDDPEFCSLLSQYLDENHFHVVAAHDSVKGLELIASVKAEIILLDSRISPQDGFTVCRGIKEDPRTRGAHVIMLSTLTEASQAGKALEAGARDCILRPFEFGELLSKLKTYTAPA